MSTSLPHVLVAEDNPLVCDAMRTASIAQSARFSWDETAQQTLAAFDDALAMAKGEHAA